MRILCKSGGGVRRVLDSCGTRQLKGGKGQLAGKPRQFAIPVKKTWIRQTSLYYKIAWQLGCQVNRSKPGKDLVQQA